MTNRRKRQDLRRQHGQTARGATLGQARRIANDKRRTALSARVQAWLEQRQVAAADRREARALAQVAAKEQRQQDGPTKPDAVVLKDSSLLMGTVTTLAGEVTGPRSWRRAIGGRRSDQHPALAGGPWPKRSKPTESWVRAERRERELAMVKRAGR